MAAPNASLTSVDPSKASENTLRIENVSHPVASSARD
jgi:hypothetical protein